MPTLQDGQAAVEQGNIQQARLIFQAILQENPRDEDAWLALAGVVTEEDDKRVCYENVLKINKSNKAAKEGLRNLEPKENPLVAALGSQVAPREAEDPFDENDEDITVGSQSAYAPEAASSEGPPTAVLVAVGLALSVVVFAIFGGVVFFALISLSGG